MQDSTQQEKTIANDTNIHDDQFYEIIRRIKEPYLHRIEAQLAEVTNSHIDALIIAMDNQKDLFNNDSFIHDEMFPFTALQAVRRHIISPIQFGTLMTLWGSAFNILPIYNPMTKRPPNFISLFTETGEQNSVALNLLIKSIGVDNYQLPYLVTMTPQEIVSGIYEKAVHLSKSEQGFWVVENNINSLQYYFPMDRQTLIQFKQTSIATFIKDYLAIRYLAFSPSDPLEMIPSFGLNQIFLEVAFKHAVRLNPVIGQSTPLDIRQGSDKRFRDIALPFPHNPLPKVADGVNAPTTLDFLFHDRYHAIRASKVTPEETRKYIALGDKIHIMQKHYDAAIKTLQQIHNEHKRVLPVFAMMIKDLPEDKRNKAIISVFSKFNREIAILNKLKKMRKANGHLKFRLWDMERAYSGHRLYDSPEQTQAQALNRYISNIILDISSVGTLPEQIALSEYSIRKIAQVAVELIQPESAEQFELLKNELITIRESKLTLKKSTQIFMKEAMCKLDACAPYLNQADVHLNPPMSTP